MSGKGFLDVVRDYNSYVYGESAHFLMDRYGPVAGRALTGLAHIGITAGNLLMSTPVLPAVEMGVVGEWMHRNFDAGYAAPSYSPKQG